MRSGRHGLTWVDGGRIAVLARASWARGRFQVVDVVEVLCRGVVLREEDVGAWAVAPDSSGDAVSVALAVASVAHVWRLRHRTQLTFC